MAKLLKKEKAGYPADSASVKGFFRLQITEEGKGVVGDSGWKQNTVTDTGIRDYLVQWLAAGSGGKSVAYMALGTGTAPGVTDTSLNGEIFHKSTNATTESRAAVSSSIIASHTAQFTAAFNSANSFVTATANISNVGLYDASLTSLAVNGSLFAGNTYASSACATNQSVNVTYQIRIS